MILENLKVKKIIAREILFGFSIVGFFLFFWVCCLGFNLVQNQRLKNNRDQMSIILDSEVNKSIMEKLMKRKQFILTVNPENINRIDEIWARLDRRSEEDSTLYYWDNRFPSSTREAIYEFGIYSASEFDDFIRNTKFTEEEEKQNQLLGPKIDFLIKQKDEIYAIGILGDSEMRDVITGATLIYTVLVFVIRYSFYVLKWCLKVIREN